MDWSGQFISPVLAGLSALLLITTLFLAAVVHHARLPGLYQLCALVLELQLLAGRLLSQRGRWWLNVCFVLREVVIILLRGPHADHHVCLWTGFVGSE